MAYKTRKIKKVNKRKYFTGLQRNHSITKHKRMYGGDVDVDVTAPVKDSVVTLDKEPDTFAEPLKFCPHNVRVVVRVSALPVVF